MVPKVGALWGSGARLASLVSACEVLARTHQVPDPSIKMAIGRVVAVTATIALIGAIIGAVIGGVLQGVAVLVAPGTTNEHMEIALVGALFGALIGAVLAPITGWVFLRRVPLGRAIAHTAIGATAGATLGLVIPLLGFRRFGGGTMLIATLAGFLVAAVRLRLKTRVPVTPTLSDGSTT